MPLTHDVLIAGAGPHSPPKRLPFDLRGLTTQQPGVQPARALKRHRVAAAAGGRRCALGELAAPLEQAFVGIQFHLNKVDRQCPERPPGLPGPRLAVELDRVEHELGGRA